MKCRFIIVDIFFVFFFFFKQKTAYEIYQCDWSSDVCSSDLVVNDVDSYLFYMLKPRYDVLGPKLGDRVKTLIEELSMVPQEKVFALVHNKNGMTLCLEDGVELTLNDLEVSFITTNGYSALLENDTVLLLKTKLTKQLYDEGFVRDFVRYVQTARKELELSLNAKVSVRVNAPQEVWSVLTNYQEYVWNETQTTSWRNLNPTYFDSDDPEVKRVRYKSGNKYLEVLFSLMPEEQLIEVETGAQGIEPRS